MRSTIRSLLTTVRAHDPFEASQIEDTLAWIDSGAPLFRVSKHPDMPVKHLVSYFVLIDDASQSLLLLDHRKSSLLLPAGGHVEPDEDPRETVRRECLEELHQVANFVDTLPFFLSQTAAAGALDVDLWFLLRGDATAPLQFDPGEFTNAHWLTADQILAMPITSLDPHMHRFVAKLREADILR